ncbi:hypothetical protein [Erwinia psidii]|nr:hypothetical protein [Erwinia psidii]
MSAAHPVRFGDTTTSFPQINAPVRHRAVSGKRQNGASTGNLN